MLMSATIRFDRPIERDKHYISPGGYEMTFSNGETVCFDFCEYCGWIDETDSSVLYCEMWGLDIDSFEDSRFLRTFIGEVTAIKEFYIYAGEYDDPEINPVELLSIELFNDNAVRIPIGKNLLGKIWDDK